MEGPRSRGVYRLLSATMLTIVLGSISNDAGSMMEWLVFLSIPHMESNEQVSCANTQCESTIGQVSFAFDCFGMHLLRSSLT